MYCFIKVAKKRAEMIEKAFAEFDSMVPDKMRIKLTNLPCEPALVGFSQGRGYERHVIYKEIKEQQRKESPSCKVWSPAVSKTQAELDETARVQADEEAEKQAMQEDPAAFGRDGYASTENENSDDDDCQTSPLPIPAAEPVVMPQAGDAPPVSPSAPIPADEPVVMPQAQPIQTSIKSFFKSTGATQEEKLLHAEINLLKRKLEEEQEKAQNKETAQNKRFDLMQRTLDEINANQKKLVAYIESTKPKA